MTITLHGLRIEQADPRTAPEAILVAVAVHREAIRAERLPMDPPWNITKLVTEMRLVQSSEKVIQVNAWDGDRVVGHGVVFLPLLDNQHLAFVELTVLPENRRQGVGRAMLRQLVGLARENGRRRLVGGTNDRVPAGQAFARRLGADLARATHTNQLDLSELDPALLDSWIARAEARAGEYDVWQNFGTYPEEKLADIADIVNVMNTEPRGDLDMEDWNATPERLREWEQSMLATDEKRHTTFVVHRPSSRIVGYSELYWQPERDVLLFQGATGVRPEHRGHGLGHWIKALNLREALRLNPRARFVRTGNADVNAPMLAINHALGFRPFIAQLDWQIDVARVEAYLNGSS